MQQPKHAKLVLMVVQFAQTEQRVLLAKLVTQKDLMANANPVVQIVLNVMLKKLQNALNAIQIQLAQVHFLTEPLKHAKLLQIV